MINKYMWIHMDRYNLIDSTHEVIESELGLEEAFKEKYLEEYDEEDYEYALENSSIELTGDKVIIDAEEYGILFFKINLGYEK